MAKSRDNSGESFRIGVVDSGVGGLTVVQEIARLSPGADIVYFGDSANVPYGNRTEQEIISLTCAMLDFMKQKGVAAVAIACNTISTLVDRFQPRYDFPVLGIIEPAAIQIAASNLGHVGLLATEFTVRTGHYQKLIRERNAGIAVHALGSRTLAALIEAADYDGKAVDAEVCRLLAALGEMYPVRDIILGCTHYPIVLDLFRKHAPETMFIDPAVLQAREVLRLLPPGGATSGRGRGSLEIFTSGGAAGFERILGVLQIALPCRIHAQR